MNITVSVERRIGEIKRNPSGWARELNKVSWNGAEAKYDIREWSPSHERMSRGITLTTDEALELFALLKKEFENEDGLIAD